MSFYKDKIVTVTKDNIKVENIILPIILSFTFDSREISKIKVVKLSALDRFNVLGARNTKTWFGLDLLRPLKKEAIRLTSTNPVGPFNNIIFNPENINEFMKVCNDNFPDKVALDIK